MPDPQPPDALEAAPPRVSVVIVSHNRATRLRACLDAVERSEGRECYQVIVADNGSTDGAVALEPEYPSVQFIRGPRNFGLTKALNLGIRAATGEAILFLHDDTVVAPGAITALASYLEEHPEATAVCPLLLDESGQPAPQVQTHPPGFAWAPAGSGTEPRAVEYATGAALMVRAFAFQQLRKIDERYGQWGSDVELCYQIRRSGRKTVLLPAVTATHFGEGRGGDADRKIGLAAFRSKHEGFASGLRATVGFALGALAGLRLGEFTDIVSGQKIDGTQKD